MSTQPEAILEENLMKQLGGLGYERVKITNEAELLDNLQKQLGKFNQIELSDKEMKAVLNYLSKGNIFQKAKQLRDRFQLTRDDESSCYLNFFDGENLENNLFQVTSQVSIEGARKNRYDVTLLLNGLPLLQIELKRRGTELKKAFNQVNRYQFHSYGSGAALFQYIQIFVISNGVNTRYFANNTRLDARQQFTWAGSDNNSINELSQFAGLFFTPSHLCQMVAHYIVLNDTAKKLMVMRPYQIYAVEAIIEQVKNRPEQNGYIWHTTGSGKTLTSFKASQIIMDIPEVHKVIFVVDRRDLDSQTTEEFNHFKEGSIDGTDSTKTLVDQLKGSYLDKNKKLKRTDLIITTIQKLNNAVSHPRHLKGLEELKQKRVVIIFDECHRSQFGQTHKNITGFFQKAQLFGFTGTPIFEKNAQSVSLENDNDGPVRFGAKALKTTKMLFGECLHKYVITDAIGDDNVLRFKIQYIGRYKQKNKTFADIQVEAIDTKELIDSPERAEKIIDYILDNHDLQTHNRAYSSIFALSSIDALIMYYSIFLKKIRERQSGHRVASIYTYDPNAIAKGNYDVGNGASTDEVKYDSASYQSGEHSKSADDHAWGELATKGDYLMAMVKNYNDLFGTSFSSQDPKMFQNYFTDISNRLKDQEKESFQSKDRLDILLVVNMFLTGFDAKMINTLYVDKYLQHHGLIQAFSRTNRIINEKKSHGNILCFRNLKKATDEAITLFANKEAKEDILVPPYEELVEKFKLAYDELRKIAPDVQSVDKLPHEEAKLEFIRAFRELMRLRNVLISFVEFSWDDLAMQEQSFEDYKSKYLDLHDELKNIRQKHKASILEDVDFELELIHRDEINVIYILKLISKLKSAEGDEAEKQKSALINIIDGDAGLRSKRELIIKFIEKNLPDLSDAEEIEDEFDRFWQEEKIHALNNICKEEKLNQKQFQALMETYIYSEKEPITDDILKCLDNQPSTLEAHLIGKKILAKMREFVETFVEGMAG